MVWLRRGVGSFASLFFFFFFCFSFLLVPLAFAASVSSVFRRFPPFFGLFQFLFSFLVLVPLVFAWSLLSAGLLFGLFGVIFVVFFGWGGGSSCCQVFLSLLLGGLSWVLLSLRLWVLLPVLPGGLFSWAVLVPFLPWLRFPLSAPGFLLSVRLLSAVALSARRSWPPLALFLLAVRFRGGFRLRLVICLSPVALSFPGFPPCCLCSRGAAVRRLVLAAGLFPAARSVGCCPVVLVRRLVLWLPPVVVLFSSFPLRPGLLFPAVLSASVVGLCVPASSPVSRFLCSLCPLLALFLSPPPLLSGLWPLVRPGRPLCRVRSFSWAVASLWPGASAPGWGLIGDGLAPA